MNCPLQNLRVIETLTVLNSPTQAPHSVTEDCSFSMNGQPSPFFTHSMPTPKREGSISKAGVATGEKDPGELQKYLQIDAEYSEEQDRNDYSFELSQLRDKLITIEEISHKEIARLKQELELEKTKHQSTSTERVSIGINTETDHRDEQIAVLKEMLKQQSLLNKQLLKETLKQKENIYQNIKITKN